MQEQFELGKVTGVRVVLDGSFILTVILFMYSYVRTFDVDTISFGFMFTCGVMLSVLIHELAHAHMGRFCGVPATHVELNGLGGLCYFGGSRMKSVQTDVLISMAGPLSNLMLWGLFYEASLLAKSLPHSLGFVSGIYKLSYLCAAVASANYWMFWFNMLPAFPLDGGNTLSALLSTGVSLPTARKTVAWLGMLVAAYCLYLGWPSNIWMLIIAFYIFSRNSDVLSSYGPPPWQR